MKNLRIGKTVKIVLEVTIEKLKISLDDPKVVLVSGSTPIEFDGVDGYECHHWEVKNIPVKNE